tara:strand:+ start:791 stop:1282 length:492 start_codon:yes stop_codon:yes gene_type:complete
MNVFQKAIKEICGYFTNDNLSLWAKENDKLEFTSRARAISGMLNGLVYSQKSQATYINGVLDKIEDAVNSSNTTDTHEAYIEGLQDNITQDEITQREFTNIIDLLKVEYKKATGDEWKPYVKQDKNQLGKNLATASRFSAVELLKSKGREIDNPALEEALKSQ